MRADPARGQRITKSAVRRRSGSCQAVAGNASVRTEMLPLCGAACAADLDCVQKLSPQTAVSTNMPAVQAMKEFRLTDKDLAVGAGLRPARCLLADFADGCGCELGCHLSTPCTAARSNVSASTLPYPGRWRQLAVHRLLCCPNHPGRASTTPRGATPFSGTLRPPRCEPAGEGRGMSEAQRKCAAFVQQLKMVGMHGRTSRRSLCHGRPGHKHSTVFQRIPANHCFMSFAGTRDWTAWWRPT